MAEVVEGPGPTHEHAPDGGPPPVVGISCSGGGIRAASYAMGALQVLDDHGLLRGEHKASYLSAVSGGSYMVSGFTAIQCSREALEATDPEVAAPAPFAPGSPEIRRLRNRLGYLTHGPGGLGPELYRVTVGIAINVIALVTLVATVSRPIGWLIGWAVPAVRWGCGNPRVVDHARVCGTTTVSTPGWAWPLLFAVLAASAAVAFWSALRRGGGRPLVWRIAASLLMAALVFGIVVIGLPQLLGWLHRSRVHDLVGRSVPVLGRHFSWVPLTGLAGVLASLGAAAQPVWRFLNPKRPPRSSNTPGVPQAGADGASAVGQSSSGVGGKLVSTFKSFASKHRGLLLNAAASITGPILVVGLFVLFAYRGASYPPGALGGGGAFEFVRWLWPAAILFVLAVLGDVNGWALHSLYAQRLGDAFGIERVRATDPTTPLTVPLFPTTYPQPESPTSVGAADVQSRRGFLPLAVVQPADFPEVLICATANLSQYGVTPTDQKSASFVFSAAAVGGAATGSMATDAYVAKAFASAADLSLIDAVSISGAAVAPEMGKMTRAPLRFLLALANVRLGVWLPSPTRVQDNTSYRAMFRRPGLTYLAREMAGSTPAKGRFVYVSDGGHFDNLGLVELLARRCDWIFTIDASGDAVDTFLTLGQALAIAQAELGVTVDIAPATDMAPPMESPRVVRATFCRGVVHYPATATEPAKDATLVVVKAGVPADAPWDVAAYHSQNPRFPTDPTTDQLYNAPRFDAYVSLGHFSMRQAWEAWGDDLEIRQGRRTGTAAPVTPAGPLNAPPTNFVG